MLLFVLSATPVASWDFTSEPVCTIWHTTETAEMRVSYDPRLGKPYAIRVTVFEGTWPLASPYSIRFVGPMDFRIATDRHRLSDESTAVIAEDTGFGNVLNGLATGLFAVPMLGDRTVTVPLDGAAEAVERFRSCAIPGVS